MAIELVQRDGTFNARGLGKFIKQAGLAGCGLTYTIVSVIGPQGSGKSTLLNHLFHTNFREMDASKGRHDPTTKGIWIAKCNSIEPCTVVLDLEGTDGSVRGEDDDTAFEKQSACFAIAVSDIVLINMWCTNIGREHLSNKPLLKAVFQAVLHLCGQSKTTLMFVIRDKSTQTPFEILEQDLKKDIKKIWDSVPKAEAHKHTQLSEFFRIEVVALPSYELQKEEFKEQVASLRQKFVHSTAPGGLACDRRGVVPAAGFSTQAQEIWKRIKENKDLDMPSVKVMVATVQCEEFANEIYSSFAACQDWLELREAVESGWFPLFGKRLDTLLDSYFSNYDAKVNLFDEETVRYAKREQLKKKLMRLVQPAFKLMFDHIQSEGLEQFKRELNDALNRGLRFATAAHGCTKKSEERFNIKCEDATSKQADWDLTETRNIFAQDLASHVTEVRAAKLKELFTLYKLKSKKALRSQVKVHLKKANDETWHGVKDLFYRETSKVASDFSLELSKFEMDSREKGEMISKLNNYATGLVVEEAMEVAGNIKYLMKERFERVFNYKNGSNLREWTEKDDIRTIAETARSSALVLLSVLAAIRLNGGTDRILDTLKEGTTTSPDLLNSDTWVEVPATKTLINPIECKSLWDQFLVEAEYTINQAFVVQEANKKKKTLLTGVVTDLKTVTLHLRLI